MNSIIDRLFKIFRDSEIEESQFKQAFTCILRSEKIVALVGAGLSTAAGIPDFRSPHTGIYAAYKTNNLSNTSQLFSYDYFLKNPKPFFDVVSALMPDVIKPTFGHYFLTHLYALKKLKRVFTQNVDGLERLAGIPDEFIVEAHGSLSTGKCLKCSKTFDFEFLHQHIAKKTVPYCSCGGVVKPDVVLFGENLPIRFFERSEIDIPDADCILVLGSSMTVAPFCDLLQLAKCPVIFINKTNVMGRLLRRYRNESNIYVEKTCDEACRSIAEHLGWDKALENLYTTEIGRLGKFNNIIDMFKSKTAKKDLKR